MTMKFEQQDAVYAEQKMVELRQRVAELERTAQHARISAVALRQHHARLNRLVLDYKRRRQEEHYLS